MDRADVEMEPAFAAFYRSHRDSVAAAIALTVRSTTLGADAADEAMTRAYADWSNVAAMSNPQGWVYRVGLNWSRSFLRRRQHEALRVDVAALARRDPDVRVDLDRALERLSVDHRAVVVARHVLGFSTAETAAALGISEGTVKSRLARALERLRAHLEEDHD